MKSNEGATRTSRKSGDEASPRSLTKGCSPRREPWVPDPLAHPSLAGEGCQSGVETPLPHGPRTGLLSCAADGGAEPPAAREAFVSELLIHGRTRRAQKSALLCLTSRWLAFALLFCCPATGWGAQAPAPPTADAFVQQFESCYRVVRSLRDNFSQTYTRGSKDAH